MHVSNRTIPKTGWLEFARFLLRRRRRFAVTNASMFPILKPGDQVLLDFSAYRKRPPQKGEIVVALHPDLADLKIIKRVALVHPDGRLDLMGENLFESAEFRGVPASKIIGRVTSKFFSA